MLCNAFAKALKLDRPVRSIAIAAKVGEPISVTVEFLASVDDAEALGVTLELQEAGG